MPSLAYPVTTPLAGRLQPSANRTYLFEDDTSSVPLGHLEGSDWVYYVNDVNGAPADLVDGAGSLVGSLDRDLFGRTRARAGSKSTTPFRFPGQQDDSETGLHYNRYRYYDPDAGRYISPDPIGLAGGLNLYSYGPNPVGWLDPTARRRSRRALPVWQEGLRLRSETKLPRCPPRRQEVSYGAEICV